MAILVSTHGPGHKHISRHTKRAQQIFFCEKRAKHAEPDTIFTQLTITSRNVRSNGIPFHTQIPPSNARIMVRSTKTLLGTSADLCDSMTTPGAWCTSFCSGHPTKSQSEPQGASGREIVWEDRCKCDASISGPQVVPDPGKTRVRAVSNIWVSHK